jgi:hypothetical protein
MPESNNRQDSVRHYIKRDTAQARAYSQAVITEGGRIVWLAGQVGAADASGKSLAVILRVRSARYFPDLVRPSRRPAAPWLIWSR